MRVGIIFGGRSSEHDISIITGVMAVNAAIAAGHTVVPIYISGDGVWYTGRNFDKVSTFAQKKYKKKVHLLPMSSGLYTYSGRKITDLDAIINCCHGMGGEDGSLSGILEFSGIPYAGSGVLASAVGMDKIAQKRLYQSEGLPITPFIAIERYQMDSEFFDIVKATEDKLTFPLIVKPANLGSSIGIGRANDYKELFEKIQIAFEWDNRIIIENALTDFIEVNCAVLGSGDKLIVSQIEQPLTKDFLSYSDKYERGGKGDTGRYLPAHISPEMSGRVRELAKKVFNLIGCSGVARIDFLIKDDQLFVNEINTVPGSLSSYLFAFDGMDFPLLIDKLLEIAIRELKKKNQIKYSFDSSVLKNRINLKK